MVFVERETKEGCRVVCFDHLFVKVVVFWRREMMWSMGSVKVIKLIRNVIRFKIVDLKKRRILWQKYGVDATVVHECWCTVYVLQCLVARWTVTETTPEMRGVCIVSHETGMMMKIDANVRSCLSRSNSIGAIDAGRWDRRCTCSRRVPHNNAAVSTYLDCLVDP